MAGGGGATAGPSERPAGDAASRLSAACAALGGPHRRFNLINVVTQADAGQGRIGGGGSRGSGWGLP